MCLFQYHNLSKVHPRAMELLKEGDELIFESCGISPENTPFSNIVSLALLMYACSNSAMLPLSRLAYAITANGVCLCLSSCTVLLLWCFLIT